MCAVEVFVYTRKWVGCTQTVQPRYIKDCGAHDAAEDEQGAWEGWRALVLVDP